MNGGIRGGTLGGLDLEPDLQTKKIIITAVFTAMDKMLDCMAIVDVVANIAFSRFILPAYYVSKG